MTNTITVNTEIKVWVGDLYEYNCGKLIGEWFTLPMDLDEIMEDVLTHKDHEYYIADVDSNINGLDNLSLKVINEIAEKLESLSEYRKEDFMMVLNASDTIDEALELFEHGCYRVFHDCESMKDVAMYCYENFGILDRMNEAFELYVKSQYDLPNVAKAYVREELENISKFYLDYELIGSDMEINRNFHKVNHNTYIELCR
jgi:hypothetical protein